MRGVPRTVEPMNQFYPCSPLFRYAVCVKIPVVDNRDDAVAFSKAIFNSVFRRMKANNRAHGTRFPLLLHLLYVDHDGSQQVYAIEPVGSFAWHGSTSTSEEDFQVSYYMCVRSSGKSGPYHRNC